MRKRQAPATWDQNGVLHAGGRALLSVGPRPSPWAPYVGLPFPPISIPAFPVQPNAQNPGPMNPTPQPQPYPAPQGPSLADLQAKESAAVKAALAIEVKAVDAPLGSEPLFAQAAVRWQDAGQAASAIASMTPGTVTADNAFVRAYHYYVRQKKDEAVAQGTAQHPRLSGEVSGPPGYGWGWEPIPQKPEPAGPVYQPPLPGPGGLVPPPSPTPTPAPAPGGSSTLFAVGLALLAVTAAVVYSGARAGRG